jgi:hypothetical protein
VLGVASHVERSAAGKEHFQSRRAVRHPPARTAWSRSAMRSVLVTTQKVVVGSLVVHALRVLHIEELPVQQSAMRVVAAKHAPVPVTTHSAVLAGRVTTGEMHVELCMRRIDRDRDHAAAAPGAGPAAVLGHALVVLWLYAWDTCGMDTLQLAAALDAQTVRTVRTVRTIRTMGTPRMAEKPIHLQQNSDSNRRHSQHYCLNYYSDESVPCECS